MANIVAGDLYVELDGQLHEIKRQLRQPNGYPFSPAALRRALQDIIEGKFGDHEPDLLRHITTVTVPSVARFVTADHFKVGTTNGVRIAYVGDDFKKVFGDRVEENIEGSPLNVYELAKASLDAPILSELGDRAETSLAHLWQLLKAQPNGESNGPLLVNGYANIFYVGIFWAVYACWRGGGWYVYARSVESPLRWHAGYRVFSR